MASKPAPCPLVAEAYPFLSEEIGICDYELATDRLASFLGLIFAKADEEDKKDIHDMCEAVYHANAGVRTGVGTNEDDLKKLMCIYERVEHFIPHYFILPFDTNEVAGMFEVARVDAKAIVRLLYRFRRDKLRIDDKLIDTFNLMSQLLFAFAMKYATVREQFVSRVYGGGGTK